MLSARACIRILYCPIVLPERPFEFEGASGFAKALKLQRSWSGQRKFFLHCLRGDETSGSDANSNCRQLPLFTVSYRTDDPNHPFRGSRGGPFPGDKATASLKQPAPDTTPVDVKRM